MPELYERELPGNVIPSINLARKPIIKKRGGLI
jgi:hypothetical protein